VKVIVSVTTTKARLKFFFYAFQSLRKQKYNNFRLVINLSSEPYLLDEGISTIPDWLKDDKTIIRFIKNNGPYRKLIPLINEISEEDIIVTADDDVLYSEDWLEKIVERAFLYPNFIVCGRARHIKKNIIGRFQNYSNWPIVSERTTGLSLIPIGCSGVAYRINLLDLKFLNDDAFAKCAPTADDIWFRLASIRKNTKVYVDPEIDNENSYIQHTMGLEQINLHRPNKRRPFYERAIIRLITEFNNYFGISLSKNDFSWKKSLEYSNFRSEGAEF
jgi:hypothetical protein